MASIDTITTADLQARLARGGAFQFWNVLTPEFFKGDMIPGSLLVPVTGVEAEVARLGLPKDAEIVVYCAGPSCPFSLKAATALGRLGYANVRAYEGGLEEWKQAGLPLTRFTIAAAA